MFDRNTANHEEHKELAKAIITATSQNGLNVQHPAVRKAMEDMHERVVNLMPNSTDADRGVAILKRGPIVAQNIKNMLPANEPVHLVDGGDPAENAAAGLGSKVLKGVGGLDVLNVVGKAVEPILQGAGHAASYGAGYVTGDDQSPNAQGQGASNEIPQKSSAPVPAPSAVDQNKASQTSPAVREVAITKDKTDEDKSGAVEPWNGADEELREMNAAAHPEQPVPSLAPPQPMPTQGTGGPSSMPAVNASYNTPPAPQGPPAPAPSAAPMPPAAVNAPPAPTGSNQSIGGAGPLPGSGNDSNAYDNSQQALNNSTGPIPGMKAGLAANVATANKYRDTQTPEAMAAAQKDKGAVLAGQLAGSGQDSAGRNSALSELANLGQNNLQAQQNYGNASLTKANQTLSDTAGTQGENINNALTGSGPGREAAQGVTKAQADLKNKTTDYNVIKQAIHSSGGLPSNLMQIMFGGGSQDVALGAASKAAGGDPQKKAQYQSAINSIYTVLAKHPELINPNQNVDIGSLETLMNSNTQKAQNEIQRNQANFGIQAGGAGSANFEEKPTNETNAYALGGEVGQTTGETEEKLVDRAKNVYHQHSQYGRDVTIAKMIEAGINPKTASTYYHNFLMGKNAQQGYALGGEVEGSDLDEETPDTEEQDTSSPQDTLRKAFGFKPKANMIQDEQEAEQTAGPATVTLAEEKVEATTEPPISAINPHAGNAGPAPTDSGEGAGPSTGNTDIGSMVANAATQRGIDPRVAHAIMQTESGGNPNAVNANKNGTTDYGPMQLNSSNIKEGEDPNDPNFTIGRALDVYKEGLDRFHGNQTMAIHAYNHGIRRTEQVGLAGATRDPYVQRVMSNMPQQQ